ncbi:MAG TPA: putative phage abortive infection protein [Chitinophagaceae bacterium]|nr:putative phage abortive infection protein [Chitinophagaceae bacterium]
MNRRQAIRMLVMLTIFLIISIILFWWNQGRINTLLPINSKRFADFGTFVSAIFGLATIIFLYFTYEATLGQLNAARESLRTTQDQLVLTKEQLFENTFFSCLKVHNIITQDLNSRISNQTLDETDVLAKRHNQSYPKEVRNFFELIYRILSLRYFFEKIDLENFFKDYRWVIDHYLRNFISIIRLVHEKDISDDKKKIYIEVLQSQSTSEELRLIIYYFINEYRNAERVQEIKQIAKICLTYNFFDSVKDYLIHGKDHGNADWREFLKIAQ